MGKSKTNVQPEVSAVVETVETQAVEQPVVENDTADKKAVIVILAYEEQMDIVRAAWDKACPCVVKTIISASEYDKVADAIPDILADETIADEFILVPATVIPCAPLRMEELHNPLVYVDGKGRKHYDRLPVALSKDDLAEIISSEGFTPDTLIETAGFAGSRAVEASFKEGNIVTPVLRANPCEHIVMEALIRKKYIIASREGLAAIIGLLKDTLLA